MSEGLARRGFDVTVVSQPGTFTAPSLKVVGERDASIEAAIRVFPFTGFVPSKPHGGRTHGLVAREFAYWRFFRDWYHGHAKAVRPDVVFVPYLDSCLYAVGALGSPFGKSPWAGVAMRPAFHYEEMGIVAPKPRLAAIKKALVFRVLRNEHLRSLLTIDEPLADYLRHRPGLSGKVVFLPQPAEFRNLAGPTDAKRSLGLRTSASLMLAYGALSRRKGVVELLQALADPAFPPSVDVLLAGQVEADLRDLLGQTWVATLRARGRLSILNRIVGAEEERMLFAAADIVWLGYRGHYTPSGVLAQAASAGCSVVACEEGIIGWQTRRHGLGEVVSPENTSEVVSAVKRLLLDRPKPRQGGAPTDGLLFSSFSTAQDILARAIAGEAR
jgi:glycosyltransferase involved in cell wall biosynthesis